MDLNDLDTLKMLLRRFQNAVKDTDLLDADQFSALLMTQDAVDIVLEYEELMRDD